VAQCKAKSTFLSLKRRIGGDLLLGFRVPKRIRASFMIISSLEGMVPRRDEGWGWERRRRRRRRERERERAEGGERGGERSW
jgi:hypothetical protein